MTVPTISHARDRGTILVAEDEIITRSTLAQFLRQAGHAVIEANSADEAAAVLHSAQRVDLVITDLETPGRLDGVDLIHLLRADFPQVRVIVAAGPAKDPAIRRKVDGLFEKPYPVETVVTYATRLLAERDGNETHTETA
ncbi:response regulator [Ferrovibrio xuzhouensis]|uniref:Response regulator n=1 Tax=Ferrovibrio xuzhouensis TaxID=1576914 RepID=A0ABV7VEH2_9PROT